MENLVLQAIGNSEVEKINKIKRNKDFLRQLINDLGQVYTLYVTNRDNQNSTEYRIKKQSYYIETIFFTANENDCVFRTKILGYRERNDRPERALGWLVEKYDTCKGDDNFMSVNNRNGCHGHVDVEIRFTDVSANLMDIIKDITRILDHEQVSKRF